MEAKRKMEELERKRQEDEDLRAAVVLQVIHIASINCVLNIKFGFSNDEQAQLAKEAEEDNQYRQQLEQERRDHELALRLAQESNSQVDDSPLLMRKYESGFMPKFVYLQKWEGKANTNIQIHFLHLEKTKTKRT